MSLDLEAVEERADAASDALNRPWQRTEPLNSRLPQVVKSAEDVPALIAEVHKLRNEVAALRSHMAAFPRVVPPPEATS